MTRKQCFIFLAFLLFLSIIWPIQCKDTRRGRIDIDGGFDQPGLDSSIELAISTDEYEDFPADVPHEEHADFAQVFAPTAIKIPQANMQPSSKPSVRAKGALQLLGGAGVGIIVLALAARGAERWAQNYIINELLAKYGHSFKTISALDKQLLLLAYRHKQAELVTLMRQSIKKHGPSFIATATRQWLIPVILELQYDCAPTHEQIVSFCAQVTIA